MHQLLQAQSNSASNFATTSVRGQKSIQLNEMISLSSFEIIKYLQMPLYVYVALITFEFGYMITIPAQRIYMAQPIITQRIFEFMTAGGVYLFSVCTASMLFLFTIFVLIRGKTLKDKQSKGEERGAGEHYDEGSIMFILIKLAGVFLVLLSSALSQLFMRVIIENFFCEREFEISYGCDSMMRTVAIYSSIASIPLIAFLILYSDIFITKLFPNDNIPWSAWNERSRLLRNGYKTVQLISITLIPPEYQVFVNFFVVYIAFQVAYERYLTPQMYNRTVHVVTTFLECQLFCFTAVDFLVNIIGFKLFESSLVFVALVGAFLTIVMIYHIDSKESSILANGSDMTEFESINDVELYLVVMLHELERLVQNEDYAHEKHIHAIIGRHMEECNFTQCACKTYEPEYDKKFTSVFSRRMTKSFSAVNSGSSLGKQASSGHIDLKKLPYKINYKTKVSIFMKEFEDRVEMFLAEYPKSYGIKLLKSFFNHKYCDSSYKALFVQLENSITCKNFKGRVFIYHLKTQIQDEMKKSTESPLSIDINSLLRFEKYKIDFERNLEDLSFNCQTFWTDLTKDDYKVENTLRVAYQVSGKIIKIKTLFAKIISINQQCIDTSSTYALVYRHILRDEATFNDLVNRIQQIKNSSKLEMQREHGIRFFDSDIYGLLMVSGELKELGRIKQANSSTRFVFGYDPKDLIGSRINKLMPAPFSAIHDRLMTNFLEQGKSNFLDRNQPLPVITKDGYLQMTLFYVKPMVSLEFGLIFSSFARKLNLYSMADEAPDLVKLHRLCIFITDQEGYIHGMSDSCSKRMGIPPPSVGQQLSLNDNQRINITQLVPNILQQEYEFELVKGMKMGISTNFLKKERQFRREFPEIACKIGDYQAEIGIHKFQYRDFKAEINLYVVKLSEKDDFIHRDRNNDFNSELSKSVEDDELTYSEFSMSTANSSVLSSHMATSKFKTFKSKIQTMESSSQIMQFSRLAMITFVLLLGIAAGNFAINLVKNQSFMANLDVITNLEILLQQVPESAHSTRQLILIANDFVLSEDKVIADYPNLYSSKYNFYADSLMKASQLFENIQNHLQTTLKDLIKLDQFRIRVKDVKTDGDIRDTTQSIQTSINLFSSKILKISSYGNGAKGGVGLPAGTVAPKISFHWNDTARIGIPITNLEQDLYYIIENGFGSIYDGIKNILQKTKGEIEDSSVQASVISIILTAISIILVLVLLPMSFQPLTQVERISQLILMSLNRLPEQFCDNETKACMEIILFLNEQKEGEKSTHEMIKKHDHRKHNKKLLKLPKSQKTTGMGESIISSQFDSYMSDGEDKLIKGKNDTASSDRNSSQLTKLSKLKVDEHFNQKRLKRNEVGAIELDLVHAKTSEVHDELDKPDYNDDRELTDEEQKQKEREYERKQAINDTFRSKRIKKFLWLILTAFIISVYYGITCFFLTLIHNYEGVYLDHYSLIGRRIQCYSNSASYLIDSLARNSNMSMKGVTNDLAWHYLQDCFKQEQDYKQLMLDGLTKFKMLDTFNSLNELYEGSDVCINLSKENLDVNNLRAKNITEGVCSTVYNGVLINGGLTETLYHFLRSIQEIMILFGDRNLNTNIPSLTVTKQLLKRIESNELISLNQIYLQTAFEQMRTESLKIIKVYFQKLNTYYNMLFGLFVSLLTIFQFIVGLVLVKTLSKQIVKIYHVVLLVPFSGRTQNDLNNLMMIKM